MKHTKHCAGRLVRVVCDCMIMKRVNGRHSRVHTMAQALFHTHTHTHTQTQRHTHTQRHTDRHTRKCTCTSHTHTHYRSLSFSVLHTHTPVSSRIIESGCVGMILHECVC